MKKILSLLLIFALLFTLAGCGAGETTEADTSPPTQESTEPTEERVEYDNLYIDIGVNEDGYYGLMGPAELTYYNGELESVYIDDPALLYFAVSSFFGGGVYLVDMPDGDAIIDELSAVAEELKATGQTELAAKIDAIIAVFVQSGPITGAST